jgi:hypothetical protein
MPRRNKKTSGRAKPGAHRKKSTPKKAAVPRVPPAWHDTVPAGATRAALHRPTDPGGGPPGSAAGPRHADGDAGTEFETTSRDDFEGSSDLPLDDDQEPLEKGPPYAGSAGGAVGGTPAEGRAKGGRTQRGLAPGETHRGDSTIGSDPRSGKD